MDLQDNESTREFTSVKALREAEEAERIEENGSEPEHEEQPEEKEPEQTNLLADVMDILESIIISVFLVLTAYTYLFCVASVEGTSMVPTLQDIILNSAQNIQIGDSLIYLCKNRGPSADEAAAIRAMIDEAEDK